MLHHRPHAFPADIFIAFMLHQRSFHGLLSAEILPGVTEVMVVTFLSSLSAIKGLRQPQHEVITTWDVFSAMGFGIWKFFSFLSACLNLCGRSFSALTTSQPKNSLGAPEAICNPCLPYLTVQGSQKDTKKGLVEL